MIARSSMSQRASSPDSAARPDRHRPIRFQPYHTDRPEPDLPQYLIAESETEDGREVRRASAGKSSGETYAATLHIARYGRCWASMQSLRMKTVCVLEFATSCATWQGETPHGAMSGVS